MVNVACVGAGFWGKNLVRSFYALGALRTCCDSSADALKKIGAQFPAVKLETDFAKVLSDPAIDAVVLATPAPTHHALARAALEAGKHVYVEKPITLDIRHAEELIALAEKAGRQLMVGHLLLYHPAVIRMKEMVRRGELGELYYIYTNRVNLGTIRSDENAVWSLAPHDISIILHLFEASPVEVSAVGHCFIQRNKNIEDVGFLNLRFADGRMANVHVSWLDPHKFRKVVVVGSKKMVVFDDMDPTEKMRVYDKGISIDTPVKYETYGESLSIRTGDIHIPKIDMTEPLAAECRHFLDCVRDNRRPLTDGRNGLEVLRVITACEESIRKNGAPVAL